MNFVFGYFVLPETLPPEQRRPFSPAPIQSHRRAESLRQLPWRCAAGSRDVRLFPRNVRLPRHLGLLGHCPLRLERGHDRSHACCFRTDHRRHPGHPHRPDRQKAGEKNTVIFGLVVSIVAAAGYAWAPGLLAVMVLLVIHAPEGFVHPALTAMMSKSAPPDAQGELQGALPACRASPC